MSGATRELLASRADVWGFLAEPFHLSDWWPGILGVEPDRRGFAPGARWRVTTVTDPLHLGPLRLPRMGAGAPSGPAGSQVLVIDEIAELERWAFTLVTTAEGRFRSRAPRKVAVTLRALEADRTEVTVATEDEELARSAVDRLYDLVQTAASP